MNRIVILIVLLCTGILPAMAQDPVTHVPFSSDRWQFGGEDRETVLFKGKEALRIRGGSAVLPDVAFTTGTIEFDMAFPLERNFQGVFWSSYDNYNHQQFYVRPHQTGKPDANQYQPIIASDDNWQLYHGEHYSVTYDYPDLEWMHVRIVIGDEYGDVYLDSTRPVLTFKLKGEQLAGAIGLFASDGSDTYFANFAYREGPESIVGDFIEYPETESGMVARWDVSDTFEEAELDEGFTLLEDLLQDRQWSTLDAEEYGITNLSRAGEQHRTVLARITVSSDRERMVPFRFGYSDRVRVFLNGTQLYSGDNGYRNRD